MASQNSKVGVHFFKKAPLFGKIRYSLDVLLTTKASQRMPPHILSAIESSTHKKLYPWEIQVIFNEMRFVWRFHEADISRQIRPSILASSMDMVSNLKIFIPHMLI